VERAFDNRSFKSQMTAALRSGAKLAVVIDEDGWSIRTLREKGEARQTTDATLIRDVKDANDSH
jgi:histidyl-tRNA synthetase